MKSSLSLRHPVALLGGLAVVAVSAQVQADTTIYQCPGAAFTNLITPQEAASRGCKAISKAQAVITVPGGSRPAAAAAPAAARQVAASPAPSTAGRASETRVDPGEQRARDSDARRILESELRKEEERLGALQKDFNGGEPERLGSERNYARYQERVADMKAAITRKESDIAALKRELAKLP